MSPRRTRLLTRRHAITWAVALSLGIGWVALLAALPSDLDPVVTLLLGVIGVFGFAFGTLMATGLLVRVLRMLGNPTRAVSSSPAELPADVVSGVCVMLFTLPSLLLFYYASWFGGG